MKKLMEKAARCATLFVLASVVLVSGQAATLSGQAGAASSGGVITVGYPFSSGINPIAFDPAQFNSSACCFSYDWPIYAGLLRQTSSGSYVPDLATSATVTNPETLDLTIRPGLVYSNGTPLNAAAVKAGFERNLTNPHTGAWDAAMYAISSIDVTGTDTLVIHFSSAQASTFYPLLADQESFMALPTGPSTGLPNTAVVGAGPFVFKSYTPDEKLVLVKNPKYWDAKAIALSGITFINVPSGPQQVNALESGLVDVEGVPAADIPTVKNNSSLQTNSVFPDANYYFIPVCKSSGPLASLKVREAMNFAINRQSINNALLFGKGEPAWSIFPTGSAYYDPSLTNIYAYNPTKAKQLLAQAGYPHGFSTTIMPLPEADTDQLAAALQAQWKQVGINVTIEQTSNYVTDLYSDNKAAMGLNPSGLPGIEKLTTQFIPGSIGDICHYSSPTLNNDLKQIEALPPSSPKLKAAWIAAQDFIIKNALGYYVDYSPLVTGASKSVKNLQVIPYVGGVLNYWVVSVPG
ncbi:MAG TPA: ABC transporter substrate-binding protein [Acidimicrobiales bacterium]|nr:ABC transporter substrate-binding protein [Acidimicrobiales bacterium]